MEMNELERQVVMSMLTTGGETAGTLKRQLTDSKVIDRKFTGAGFYTRFEVAGDVPRISDGALRHFGNVAADIDGLQHGAGFVLHIRKGIVYSLEGYS